MKRGTKSVLFGVHQFIWHPLTVAYAWKKLYRRWPSIYQWIAIFCHDIGYWGKAAMDSADGQTHPERGAKVAWYLVYWAARLRGRPTGTALNIADAIHDLALCHSTHYAQKKGRTVSKLYLPDKACVLLEPIWFYLLRAWLSGELKEYVENDNHKRWLTGQSVQTSREWLVGYRLRIFQKVVDFRKDEALRRHKESLELLHRALRLQACQCDICAEKK